MGIKVWGVAVVYPQQPADAHPNKCWNWFTEPRGPKSSQIVWNFFQTHRSP